jgi:hypothetical protein
MLFLFTILLSCKTEKEKEKVTKNQNITETSSEIIDSNNEILIEAKTLVDTTKIRSFAESILNNTAVPSDNDETFECLKQIFTTNRSDLEFYFNVFRVIVKKSDGALAEVIGLEIMNFLRFNPDYFIKQYSNFDLEEKNMFINHLAFEFYFTQPEHNEEIDRFFQEVNLKLKSNTESKRKYLNSIKELTKIETQRIVDEY